MLFIYTKSALLLYYVHLCGKDKTISRYCEPEVLNALFYRNQKFNTHNKQQFY